MVMPHVKIGKSKYIFDFFPFFKQKSEEKMELSYECSVGFLVHIRRGLDGTVRASVYTLT